MITKADQARLRDLMREAVTMLCKTGLAFQSKFCVEGLLGITVDDKDIMLINLNETILKYDNDDSCEVYQVVSNSEGQQEKESMVIKSESDHEQLQIDESDSADSLIIAHVNETDKLPLCNNPNVQNNGQKRKTIESLQVLPETANGEKKKGFFSPAVDQIIQEYEQQQYTDSSSLLYMARKRRRKYPDHVTELHTQGLLPILPQSEGLISLSPKQAMQVIPPPIIIAQPPDKSRMKIKKEPGLSESENSVSTKKSHDVPPVPASKKSQEGPEPILIEPKTSWASPQNSQARTITENNSSVAMMANMAANVAMEDTLWVEDAILKQEGCFVSTRVILRKHGSLRGEHVVHAMKCMTHPRGNALYIGEYRQSGRIQVFYKCPPLLLSARALKRYNMTLDQYSNYFFGNPKPNNGTPSQWAAYINTVLDGIPYSPKLFPIESMNLVDEDLRRLCTKRDMLADRFVGARDDDSVLGGFRNEDGEGAAT